MKAIFAPRGLLALPLALLLLCPPLARACINPTGEGPTVAIVLSGGGALANTQIGALAVLEEMDIPIHCIVGTSMGSVVGALYASGYSVEQIRTIFREAPWPDLFSDARSRRNLPYLEKERRDEYFSDYIAGFTKDGLALPGGVTGMGSLQLYYRQLTRHIPIDMDFDELRVPYRAVAMNLSTGEARAFERGDLVEAMLASMAVPGVFAPRRIDGEVYVDGGLAQNLPVQTALEMGADIVIGVDLTIEPPRMGERVAITELTQQLGRLTVWKAYKEQLELLSDIDVVIRPDIEGLGVSAFALHELGYTRGREAVAPHVEALQRIRDIAAPARQRELTPGTPTGVLAELEIRNPTKIGEDEINERFAFAPDVLDDPERLKRKLRDLASFGGFGEVDLALDDALMPVLSVKERPLGTTLAQAGLRASSNLDGDSNFSLLARISRRPFSSEGGELSLSGEFGTNLGATLELYQPFGAEGRFFVLPSIAYRAEELLFDIEDTRVGEFWQQDTTFQVRLGRELGQWGILSFEALASTGRIRPQVTIAPEVFTTQKYDIGGAGVRFAMDTLDSVSFARSGVRVLASAQRLADFANSNTNDKYRFALLKGASFGRTGFNLRVVAESIRTEDNDPIEILSLGGFRQLSAFSPNSLPTNEYLLGSLEVFQRLTGTDRVLSLPIYVGASLEYANLSFDTFAQRAEENYGSLSLYLGADTVVGPVFVGAGFSDEGRYAFFLNVGRNFR